MINFRPSSLGLGGSGGEYHRDNGVKAQEANLEAIADWYPFRTDNIQWQTSLGFIPSQTFQSSLYFVIDCGKDCKITSTNPINPSPFPAIMKGLTLMGLIDHNLGIASQIGNASSGGFQYGAIGILYGIRSLEVAHFRLFVFLNYYPLYAHLGGDNKWKSNNGLTSLRYGVDYKF